MKPELLPSVAKDQLNLVLSFFPRVDAKSSVVFAVNTAMVGYLASRFPPSFSIPWWLFISPIIAFALLGTSFICLYKGAFPILTGGNDSLVYFQEIAKKTEAKFIQEFSSLSESDYSSELLGQAWRNSQILATKFKYLKRAFIFLALAVIPWTIALIEFATVSGAAQLKTP
jgi:hypothetical protein